MPYEDPIEAALRALTDVEWKKRQDLFEARTNKTDMLGIQALLGDHRITVASQVSTSRSGRYISTVNATEIPKIQKAVEVTGAKVKSHRRKWHST